MRELINIVEAKGPACQVARHTEPNSGRVVASTVVHATWYAELNRLVRAWMEEQGLDPDDEDDLSYIAVTAR